VTRIIAGASRGRRLAVPPGTRTRPTSDRAREGLFATVTAVHGPLTGAGVLDLYAGSGAVGLEALSRGAARALLVESDAAAARVIGPTSPRSACPAPGSSPAVWLPSSPAGRARCPRSTW
jgi:16S rRNA (guanine966-N2)-methyltransferase